MIPGLSLLACSNGKAVNTQFSPGSLNVHEHAHTFRCPMHPEVTGNEGDTCSKCGMKLEPNEDALLAASTYFMQFTTTPSVIKPLEPVTLSFVPRQKQKPAEDVALDIEHEKKIHLILVSEDLSWFDHVHPEYAADGSYKVEARFPVPGKYKAFADYKPVGSGHVVDKIDINVEGLAPAPTLFTAGKLTGSADKYTFSLTTTNGKFITGEGLHMRGVFKKDGKEIDANTLDNYLGAKAHIVVISMNEKEYLHVHPEVANGQLDIHTTFEKPGIYRGWIQFNADGKLHTIDFTVPVVQGPAKSKTPANASDHHSGHAH